MSAMTDDDLLPEDFLSLPSQGPATKGSARPLVRTKKQQAAALAAQAAKERAALEAAARKKVSDEQARLAQIVNLHIAGFSLADIGAQIGATEAEVDAMLTHDAARYVRSQPQLRSWVRNYISGKYNGLLDAVYDEAVDKNNAEKLDNSLQALRILKEMARLHGAEAPTQAEVKIDAKPEAVQRMVEAIAKGQGLSYDENIFDVEVVEDEPLALESPVSGNADDSS